MKLLRATRPIDDKVSEVACVEVADGAHPVLWHADKRIVEKAHATGEGADQLVAGAYESIEAIRSHGWKVED